MNHRKNDGQDIRRNGRRRMMGRLQEKEWKKELRDWLRGVYEDSNESEEEHGAVSQADHKRGVKR
jgi:hypothetical protein